MENYVFYVTVERGLEELVAWDLKNSFKNIEVLPNEKFRGKVFLRGSEQHIYLLNYSARSINRVILLLLHTEIRTLDDIYKSVKSIDWPEYINKNQTFAIRATRKGKHDFTSLDIARVAGSAVIDGYLERTGTRLKVNLKEPDVSIHVEVIDNQLLIGIDTTGPSLHMRRYRVYNHPMPLRTTLAYLMVRLSKWNPSRESLLDPMCGGGTIPIEAALWARRIPIAKFRKNEYNFYKLKFLNVEKANEILEKLLDMENHETFNLIGMDISKNHVEGAIRNATSASVIDTITFLCGDARKLSKYFQYESFDVIVTNPPYHLRPRKMLLELYRDFLNEALKIIKTDGRLVIITSEKKLLKTLLNTKGLSYNVLHVFRYGSLDTGIFLVSK